MGKTLFLKIGNKQDRTTVASILYANGYRVEPARVKVKNSYEYYVKCELVGEESTITDMVGDDNGD